MQFGRTDEESLGELAGITNNLDPGSEINSITFDQHVADRLRCLREERGIFSTRELSEAAEVDRYAYCQAEAGICFLTCEDFEKLAKYFAVNIGHIMN